MKKEYEEINKYKNQIKKYKVVISNQLKQIESLKDRIRELEIVNDRQRSN